MGWGGKEKRKKKNEIIILSEPSTQIISYEKSSDKIQIQLVIMTSR